MVGLTGMLLPLVATIAFMSFQSQRYNLPVQGTGKNPNDFGPGKDLLCAFLVKSTRWFVPNNHKMKPYRNTSLSYLCILLLMLSSDIEKNPGPDFPCGLCGQAVLDTDCALECDTCLKWFHIDCQGISQNRYSDLSACDVSFSWICLGCDRVNISNLSSHSISSQSSENSFHTLTDINDSTGQTQPDNNIKKKNRGSLLYKLKVLLVNCQSIVNKKPEFMTLVDQNRPDVVVGTESWLNSSHKNSEFFPSNLGYTPFRRDRDGKGGGVFILVKDTILATEQKHLMTNCEIIWVKLHLQKSKPLYIAAYYRPNENDSHSAEELKKSLQLTRSLKGNIWILGDFNYPKLSWKNDHTPFIKPGCNFNNMYEDFIDLLSNFNLTQMVTENTRGDNILDLFLTSNHTLISCVKCIPGIADHEIVSFAADVRPKETRQPPRDIPLYKKANWEGFKTFMEQVRIDIIKNYNSKSVEEIWQKLTDSISLGISKFVPTKRFSGKKSLPWITQNIKRLIRKRDLLYQKLKKNRNSCTRSAFLNCKNLVKRTIKKAHNDYIEYVLGVDHSDNSTGDSEASNFRPKKLYSLLKSARQDSTGIGPLKDHTGSIKSENHEKVNILNKQFQSVFTPISPPSLSQSCLSEISNMNICPPSPYKHYPVMPDINISTSGVEKLLSNLKPDKAAGPDNIKPLVLKNLSHQIAPILQILFQKSLDTGDVPRTWTKANVVPLFKKGDKEDPANYRPISLTCIVCKVLEHIVASKLTEHFTKYNILYDLQHGFRQSRSCETQLIQLVDEISQNLTHGKQTDLVLLDFTKAFDKVSHLKLLHKLKVHGVNKSVTLWIQNFLIGRSQKVIMEGASSAEVPVTSGVPQGSVLGPLLFLLYINDLPDTITSQVRLFADDTAVYLTINSMLDCDILQKDLDKLAVWEKTWDMEFNPNKCVVMSIYKTKNKFSFPYKLHGQILENVRNAKYLGVTISSDLSWNNHIENITSSANKTLSFLSRNIITKNQKIREVAYKTMVRPQLEYSSSVWAPHSKVSINKLEKVQRRAARWTTSNYSYEQSNTELQHALGWPTLQDRRDVGRVIMFYKIIHGLVAIPLPTYLQQPARVTRHMHPFSFRQIHTSSNYFKYSFFPCTVVMWNSLPASVVVQPNLEGFKCKMSPSLISNRP